ncbi:MAG: methyl-accepting chemotaxis protein [Desulfofustis sp. PB-SRB1]|jgi:methyl-accepting chemotaxis protein|nr:methyl-accepting chemotaxis protein [Desulfofustis sp. PB-SRB1]MBM1003177.1 methyl-accepting chemotaxis protein [Desulfofustis sp. PB-SRB1]HBH28485.1 methyl-accepting chemotaxis protein [Desulfofustis sp.]
MVHEHRRKIKNYLINKEVQIPLIVITFAYTVLIVLTAEIMVMMPFIKGMFAPDQEVQQRSAQVFIETFNLIIPSILVIFVIFSVYQIWFSHRFCGPMVPLEKAIRRFSEKRLDTRITLRKHDFIKPIADTFNSSLETCGNDIDEIKNCNTTIIDLLEKVIADDAVSKEAAKEKLKEAARLAQMEKEHLDKFIT